MVSQYNPEEIELLFRQWAQLGFVSDCAPLDAFVNPELLIVMTTRIGRFESRLLKVLLTWIRDFHDLINVQRMHVLLDRADIPVLAAIITVAISHGAHHRLATLFKHCTAYSDPQPLFLEVDDHGFFDKIQRKKAGKVYLDWGLYGNLEEFYDDAMQDRKTVLKNNHHLAIRALVGPAVRAEILYELMTTTKIHIRALAKKLDYAYSTVHREVTSLAVNSFVHIEEVGTAKVLTLNPRFLKYIANIPL
jgi:hypothetical protein